MFQKFSVCLIYFFLDPVAVDLAVVETCMRFENFLFGVLTDRLMSVLKSLSTLILALAVYYRDSGQVPKAVGTKGCLLRTGREARPRLHFPLRFPCSQLPHWHYSQ